jgi:hypothetical protein
MPLPANLTKAQLIEIEWNNQHKISRIGKKVNVQFNPESLSVNFANQVTSSSQRGGAGRQYVGKGATRLTMDLWYDVTVPLDIERGAEQEQDDVRKLTQEVVFFMTPKKKQGNSDDKFVPPGVRFVWGTFLFDGVMESINEVLDYFSEDGVPLRAKLAVSIAQQELQFQFNNPGQTGTGASAGAGTTPMQQTRQGDTLQGVAGRNGRPGDWKQDGRNNGVDNPRHMPTGTSLNMGARR